MKAPERHRLNHYQASAGLVYGSHGFLVTLSTCILTMSQTSDLYYLPWCTGIKEFLKDGSQIITIVGYQITTIVGNTGTHRSLR